MRLWTRRSVPPLRVHLIAMTVMAIVAGLLLHIRPRSRHL